MASWWWTCSLTHIASSPPIHLGAYSFSHLISFHNLMRSMLPLVPFRRSNHPSMFMFNMKMRPYVTLLRSRMRGFLEWFPLRKLLGLSGLSVDFLRLAYLLGLTLPSLFPFYLVLIVSPPICSYNVGLRRMLCPRIRALNLMRLMVPNELLSICTCICCIRLHLGLYLE